MLSIPWAREMRKIEVETLEGMWQNQSQVWGRLSSESLDSISVFLCSPPFSNPLSKFRSPLWLCLGKQVEKLNEIFKADWRGSKVWSHCSLFFYLWNGDNINHLSNGKCKAASSVQGTQVGLSTFGVLSITILNCKTQNSGLRSKEGKTARPNEPVQQMQHARGFIVGCTNRVTLISWEAEHTEQQIGQKTILSAYCIRVTKWLVTCLQSNPIGTNFAGFCSNLKQFYWYKRRGLLFKLRRPRAFYWVHIDWLAPGHLMGAGNPPISRETETQVLAASQP